MSLLQWFSKKPQPTAVPTAPESSGLGHMDATVPLHPSVRRHVDASSASHAANRKSKRLERRELLYAVVRQSMTRAGVLSSSYKFKVLSLDSRGSQYLIMMDIARQHAGEIGRFAEIEGEIAKSAKTHDILVTSVYWRVYEHVTTGLTKQAAPMPAPTPESEPAAAPPPAVVPAKPRFEPLQADEMSAFKQALARGVAKTSAPRRAEVVLSGHRNTAQQPVFQDTQLEESHSPLSGTQYGDLN
jgi:hypothetical protein